MLTLNCVQERAQISFIPWQAEEFNFELGHPRCAFSLIVMYEIVDTTNFFFNKVIPLCINSIYLLYYTIPSTQHKSQSYRYMFRLNKSSSGVSKNHN